MHAALLSNYSRAVFSHDLFTFLFYTVIRSKRYTGRERRNDRRVVFI
jgi:hypothetical protein